MIAAADREPADWDDYSPGVVLYAMTGETIGTLPLGAWPQVWAWFRQAAPRQLLIRDETGQRVAIERRAVALVIRRDVVACVALEARARAKAQTWTEDDE